MPGLITWWKLDLAELAPAAHSDAVAATGSELLRRLGEPHRRYHTAQHIVEMFWAIEELEAVQEVDRRGSALARVAAWFHDAIYDVTRAHDSERESANLARKSLTALGLGANDVDRVQDLILLSAAHELPFHDALGATFHDADLWVLSADEDRFDEYCQQVRDEYTAVPGTEYAAVRTTVLEPFLRRSSIYATEHARGEWEGRARLNLARELHRLAA